MDWDLLLWSLVEYGSPDHYGSGTYIATLHSIKITLTRVYVFLDCPDNTNMVITDTFMGYGDVNESKYADTIMDGSVNNFNDGIRFGGSGANTVRSAELYFSYESSVGVASFTLAGRIRPSNHTNITLLNSEHLDDILRQSAGIRIKTWHISKQHFCGV